MKKFFTMLTLCICCIMCMKTNADAQQYLKLTMANELCEYVYQGYNGGIKGPIIVTKGICATNTGEKEVYLITLSGTEIVENQSTGYITDLKVGFNCNNAYLRNTVSVILNNIPRESNLILSGHSLGGMVAQQVAADNSIKKNYNVLNTVTFGSPMISKGRREGTVKRLGDIADIVPYLSVTGRPVSKVSGLNRENGGYAANAYQAHVDSYIRSDIWGAYDVLGQKGGECYFMLDLSTQRYFKAPRR